MGGRQLAAHSDGLYFRWNARYTEDNRDHFYAAFLGWLERESRP